MYAAFTSMSETSAITHRVTKRLLPHHRDSTNHLRLCKKIPEHKIILKLGAGCASGKINTFHSAEAPPP